MTGSLLLCIALAYFVAAYFGYGGYLKRIFKVDPNRPTPAKTQYDGIDFVPTPTIVLFGHHFASIAGPGPIVGPIMAAYFGWLPALMWILVGCVFVGAFHDFAALVISVRNKGHSISFVMEKMMGFSGRQLFVGFCFACLILVVAVFTNMIAGMFVKVPAVATASLAFIAMAPIFAYCTNKLGFRLKSASFIFIPLVFLAVPFGSALPLDLQVLFGLDAHGAQMTWTAVLAVYILCASVLPVQWLLQPRDYMNSFLLYGTLALGFVSILAYGPEINMDSFKGFEAVTADGNMSSLFPTLFIFIACGACSGFHALVASGTTSKQIRSEKDMLPVGYGAMLVEGILGVMALVAVMAMAPDQFQELGKNPVLAFSTGISNFCSVLGLDVKYSMVFLSLAISAFMMTSLDTATRLGRFLVQELFLPRAVQDASENEQAQAKMGLVRHVLTNKYWASLFFVAISIFMALSGEAAALWPIFGASNQLMAGLTFLVITLWLLSKQVNWMVAFIPMLFMMVMSLWGIFQIIHQQWGHNVVLVSTGILLSVMSILMVLLGASIITHHLKAHFSGKHAGGEIG
ncbi:MAG TPA: carbon starvation protein A [Succinivibrionaceae bacterium]|nr:carbon starvation protein A [Succinivibrionaceae bacterium]